MSDAAQAKDDSSQWFLRTGGETVFGPVSTEGLIVWAEQGRILPGHEVSTDRKKWVQAVAVEALDMRWFVDDGEGELRGPLNRLAAEALIRSGKVPEGSQLVSADDVEQSPAAEREAARRAEAESQVAVREAAAAQARVRELEAEAAALRVRLAAQPGAAATEALRAERDAAAAQLKASEEQREALLRNAEKDTRTHERKLEQLRQQIKKLEQQAEESASRLLLADQAAAARAEQIDRSESDRMVAEARTQTEARLRRECDEQLAAAAREADELRDRLAAAEKAQSELRALSASERVSVAAERETLGRRISELEQAVSFHAQRLSEDAQTTATREDELENAVARAEANARRAERAEAAQSAAEEKARAGEAAFAELLADANARDNGYLEKIAALEKACAQPPDETARFFADQAAVYELAKSEADELGKLLEAERRQLEELKEWGARRQQALVERRQALLTLIGSGPAEMTRRSLREQPADPNAARLRLELDALRAAHEREQLRAEERERDTARKLRVYEAEAAKLQALAAEGDKSGRRAQELAELLQKREQELADERKNREAEREQYQGSQQALLTRIDMLEKSAKPSTPDELQMAEARNVKIATWMRLKK